MGGKTVAVIGATGAQGGGLARSIQSDPMGPLATRAVTRNPDSDKAHALIDLGAEVVVADLDDEESLVHAFAGCHGAFCVTNFWEHLSPEKEKAQARNMARAAKRAGLRHVVWSTLEDMRQWVPLDDDRMPTLMGEYKVPHFDAKGEADQYFRDAGVPTTFLQSSFYWDNLLHFGMEPQRGEDGSLVFALPMGDRKLPGMASEDIGKAAHGIFKAGEPFIGQTIAIAGEHLTGAEMAATLGRVLGEEVSYYPVPFDVYRALDFPGAADLGNMFQVKHDFNDEYVGARDLDATRDLNPELQSFETWLRAHADEIPRH